MADPRSIVEALSDLRRGQGPAADAEPDADLDRRLQDGRARRRGHRGLSLNLTPMIDVTFLLLVFFVCTTRALEKQALLRADVSEHGGTGVASDALALDETPLRIEVLREGGATAYRVMAPTPQPSDPEQLTVILASRRYGPDNPGGLFASDQPIELAPAKDTPWDDTVAAFNAVTRAGYTRISFARPR